MDHLKEQLKNHYEKNQPSEEFLQRLSTLTASQAAPAPVRVHPWRKYLTPIAAMFIIAVSILGGGKYLMDAMPLTAIPPESAPTAVVPVESAADFDDMAPTDVETDPAQDVTPTAPAEPEPGSIDEPAPEKTAPEQSSSGVTTPQPPTSPEPTNPVPPDDITDPKPPIEIDGSADDPAPPPEDDVPPYEPGVGSEDDPPTDPGENDPVDPPDDPVVPPIDIPDIPFPPDYNPDDGETPARPSVEPEPPDDPIDPPDGSHELMGEPSAKPSVPPEITARYVKENGQHMVYLTNCDTGRTHTINLTSYVTANGYFGIHSAFGWQFLISLTNADYSFSTESVGPGTSQEADISKIVFKLKMIVIGPAS